MDKIIRNKIEFKISDKKKFQRLIYGDFHNILRNLSSKLLDWKYIPCDLAILENNKKRLQLNYLESKNNIIVYEDMSDNDSILTLEELKFIENIILGELEEYLEIRKINKYGSYMWNI
jgi:hypothetical protein